MAKLARESRLRERRLEKQARKDARKRAASNPAYQDTPRGEQEEALGVDPDAVEPADPRP